jgi:3-oxoacyl-[acyl-carrier-protein] synthase-3
MFILGVGAAYPEVEVSDDFLASIGLVPTEEDAAVIARAGVRSRRVSLPLDYIQTSKNRVVLDGRPVATATPTSLGAAAAREAASRAGIAIEQVGLVLADTATPYQTCPSEAQRVASALGLKVPAYDVVTGAAALPQFIEMLSRWKADRLPEYILFLSTNTPSQHGNYESDALSAHLYGDGAFACVVSVRHPGRLKVARTLTRREGSYKTTATVERHVVTDRARVSSANEVRESVVSLLKDLGVTALTPSAKVIGPQRFAAEARGLAGALGVAESSFVSEVESRGYALGASSGAALASVWDSIEVGQQVVVAHVGDGVSSGVVLVGA